MKNPSIRHKIRFFPLNSKISPYNRSFFLMCANSDPSKLTQFKKIFTIMKKPTTSNISKQICISLKKIFFLTSVIKRLKRLKPETMVKLEELIKPKLILMTILFSLIEKKRSISEIQAKLSLKTTIQSQLATLWFMKVGILSGN